MHMVSLFLTMVHILQQIQKQSKWTIDLNVKFKTIALLEKKLGGNLCDIGSGKG